MNFLYLPLVNIATTDTHTTTNAHKIYLYCYMLILVSFNLNGLITALFSSVCDTFHTVSNQAAGYTCSKEGRKYFI